MSYKVRSGCSEIPLWMRWTNFICTLCLKLIKIMCAKWIYAIYEKFPKSVRSHPDIHKISKKKQISQMSKNINYTQCFFVYNVFFFSVLHSCCTETLVCSQTCLLAGVLPDSKDIHVWWFVLNWPFSWVGICWNIANNKTAKILSRCQIDGPIEPNYQPCSSTSMKKKSP